MALIHREFGDDRFWWPVRRKNNGIASYRMASDKN
jgi:hypothetical protein